MRILIILPENPPKKILVELSERKLIQGIKDLIGRKKHFKAISIALKKGRLEKEIKTDEFENLGTDLILREDGAHWDAMRER